MIHVTREEIDPLSKYFNCKSPILDRRLMALKYSETFKISSRVEASVVLKLTQQLSDSLEQYFLNCKRLEVLESGVTDNTTEIYGTSTKILPCIDYGNLKLGLESTVAKQRLDIEPTLSASTSTNAHSLDRPHEKIEVTSGEEHTSEVISSRQDAFPKRSSSSGLQSRKPQKFEDPDEIPFMSSQSITLTHDEPPQPLPVEGFSSPSCSTTSPYCSSVTESTFSVTHAHVYGSFQVEQNSEHSSGVSQTSLNSGKGIKGISESKLPVVSSDLEIKAQSDLSMKNTKSDFNASSLHSSSSQDTTSSSQTQRKTSKTLSPDILQLLKGKDATTVTNILKTLSPFYPALQDVNLEILAQVLVNTGALD